MTGGHPTRGILLGLAGYAAFSFSDAFIKLLGGAIPTFELMFLGGLVGFLALPFVRQPGEPWSAPVRPRLPKVFAARMVFGAINNLGALVAFTRLPMAETFALIFLMPIFVTLLSMLVLKEHVGWRRGVAVLVGFAGVMVVLRPGFREVGLGHIAAIACGLAGAVNVILVRLAGDREWRLTLYATPLVGNVLVAGLLMLPSLAPFPLALMPKALGFALLSALGGVLLMLATLAAPVNRVAPAQYSQMLWAVLLGWLLFAEHLDAATWIGIAVIVGSGLFTLLREEHVTGWWHRMRMLLP